MKIIAFGDIHFKIEKFKQIPGVDNADIVIVTGDLTNFGGIAEAETIIKTITEINGNLYAVHGNLDTHEVDSYLKKKNYSIHGTSIKYNNIGIFGVGGSNITPFKTPIEYSENEITEIIMKAYENLDEMYIKILISHVPPLNTKTDLIPGNVHVGSSAIREFIEKYQPDICLTGHIHEAKGCDWIGKTKILNPGMLNDGNYIEVVIDEENIKSCINKI